MSYYIIPKINNCINVNPKHGDNYDESLKPYISSSLFHYYKEIREEIQRYFQNMNSMNSMNNMNNKTDMTKTKNKIPDSTNNFLNNLSEYLQTQLYFYGSVQRYDYFPGNSDIDIDIFTDNEKSTINKLSNFLQINKTEFKKIIWKKRDHVRMR
jgi:preprotein translocase subunit SecE